MCKDARISQYRGNTQVTDPADTTPGEASREGRRNETALRQACIRTSLCLISGGGVWLSVKHQKNERANSMRPGPKPGPTVPKFYALPRIRALRIIEEGIQPSTAIVVVHAGDQAGDFESIAAPVFAFVIPNGLGSDFGNPSTASSRCRPPAKAATNLTRRAISHDSDTHLTAGRDGTSHNGDAPTTFVRRPMITQFGQGDGTI